jgi:hypothetical protein
MLALNHVDCHVNFENRHVQDEIGFFHELLGR